MKLIITITVEVEVSSQEELAAIYDNALTIEEAASKQQVWFESGAANIFDVLDGTEKVVVTYEP
jgi:hypothetical protein